MNNKSDVRFIDRDKLEQRILTIKELRAKKESEPGKSDDALLGEFDVLITINSDPYLNTDNTLNAEEMKSAIMHYEKEKDKFTGSFKDFYTAKYETFKSIYNGEYKQLMADTSDLKLTNSVDKEPSEKRILTEQQFLSMLENGETDFSNLSISNVDMNDFWQKHWDDELVLNFQDSVLTNVDMSHAHVTGSNFKGATLNNCSCVEASFSECDFTDAILSDVEFHCNEGRFYGVNFTNAKLHNVEITRGDDWLFNEETGGHDLAPIPNNFSGALINGCRISSNSMHNVSFEGAIIENTRLDRNNFEGANYKNLTVKNVTVDTDHNTVKATHKWLAEVAAQNIELTNDDLAFANEQTDEMKL